jgi:hypothetical protein
MGSAISNVNRLRDERDPSRSGETQLLFPPAIRAVALTWSCLRAKTRRAFSLGNEPRRGSGRRSSRRESCVFRKKNAIYADTPNASSDNLCPPGHRNGPGPNHLGSLRSPNQYRDHRHAGPRIRAGARRKTAMHNDDEYANGPLLVSLGRVCKLLGVARTTAPREEKFPPSFRLAIAVMSSASPLRPS